MAGCRGARRARAACVLLSILPLTLAYSTGCARYQHRSCRLPRQNVSRLRASVAQPELFVRGLGFLYGTAFAVALRQNKGLIGDRGIWPARLLLDRAESNALPQLPPGLRLFSNGPPSCARSSGFENLRRARDASGRPIVSLLWAAGDRGRLNPWLDAIAATGLATSAFVTASGAFNFFIGMALWLLYKSIVSVGGPFYAFAWETLTLEIGFWASLAAPFASLQPGAAPFLAPWFGDVVFRWLLFRVMLGAGLIKWRTDPSWRAPRYDAMCSFYETQPAPNPISRLVHFGLPRAVHRCTAMATLVVEMVAPFLLLVPITAVSRFGASLQVIFQALIITTGNLSWLNYLTLLPAIWCFRALPRLQPPPLWAGPGPALSYAGAVAATAWLAKLSYPVIKNLLSPKQRMNESYDMLRLVSTYGAFGTVTQERFELIVEGASSEGMAADAWEAYEFPVKPGDPRKRLRVLSPWHVRLDWCLWLAALRDAESSRWLPALLLRLLQKEPDVMRLLDRGRTPPLRDAFIEDSYARVDLYRYAFTRPGSEQAQTGVVWERQKAGRFYPRSGVASVDSLKASLPPGYPL